MGPVTWYLFVKEAVFLSRNSLGGRADQYETQNLSYNLVTRMLQCLPQAAGLEMQEAGAAEPPPLEVGEAVFAR